MQVSVAILFSSLITFGICMKIAPVNHAIRMQKLRDVKSIIHNSEELSTLFNSSIKYWDIDEFPNVSDSVSII